MTYQEREAIFAKDYITIPDIQLLLGYDYSKAAKTIRDIRRKTDRLKTKGRIHVQDYLDYFGITSVERYAKTQSATLYE